MQQGSGPGSSGPDGVPWPVSWLRDVSGQGPRWGKVAGAALATPEPGASGGSPCYGPGPRSTQNPHVPRILSILWRRKRGSERLCGTELLAQEPGREPRYRCDTGHRPSPAGWGSSESSVRWRLGGGAHRMRTRLGLHVPGRKCTCVCAHGGPRCGLTSVGTFLTDSLRPQLRRKAIWR